MSADIPLIWMQYRSTGDARLRESLIQRHLGLARHVVDRLNISVWGCLSREDLVRYAVIGLIDAVDRYDPLQNVSFAAFAVPRIRGAVLDALRSVDWAPRSVRQREARLSRAYAALESRLGRAPTDQEVADYLGVTPEALEQMVTDVARSSLASLDDLLTGETASGVTRSRHAGGLQDEGAEDPLEMAAQAEARRCLADAIRALPERERLVVTLYYYEDLTLREIGRVLGVTEQRVSQIHSRAMLRLSHRLARHRELVAAM